MTDIFEWFLEQEEEFEMKGDHARLAMASLYTKGSALSDSDPQAMIRLFREGRDHARRLREPWWVFFYEVWLTTGYLWGVCDLNNALHLALHCVNETRKPELKEHPFRITAHNTLLSAYLEIDPLGYAGAIRESLRSLSREIPRQAFGHRYVLLGQQAYFLLVQGRWKQARKLAMRMLAEYDQHQSNNDWFLMSAYLSLCAFAWRERQAAELRQFAVEAEKIARDFESGFEVAGAQVWQAVAARLNSDEKLAKRLVRSARNRVRRLGKRPTMGYYDALVAFHELGEDLERCLEARTAELKHIEGTGRLGYEADVRIKRCELLARLGRLAAPDLAQVRASLKPLKNPQPYRKRLDKLAGPGTRQRRA
ncbi:MAG: hypothetical protein AB7K24_05945 [Gemmataceae bacterium]